MAAPILQTQYLQSNLVVTLPTTTPVNINASDSGKFILVAGQAAAQVINLPAITPGLCYKFLKTGVAAAGTSAITPTAAVMQGQINSTITFTALTNAPSVTFGAPGSMGDMIDVYCDGTNWITKGYSKTALGLTSP